jgi:hypothetical protein
LHDSTPVTQRGNFGLRDIPEPFVENIDLLKSEITESRAQQGACLALQKLGAFDEMPKGFLSENDSRHVVFRRYLAVPIDLPPLRLSGLSASGPMIS